MNDDQSVLEEEQAAADSVVDPALELPQEDEIPMASAVGESSEEAVPIESDSETGSTEVPIETSPSEVNTKTEDASPSTLTDEVATVTPEAADSDAMPSVEEEVE